MNEHKDNKTISVIANIISTIVLVFSIIVCVLVIASMKSSSGVAHIFGYSVLSVKSDSMEPEFFENDLIVVKCTKTTDVFEVGDIVSFFAYDNSGTRFINTHRIVEVIEGDTRNRYVTKGDNAAAADDKKIYSSNIIGQYTGRRISGLGKIVDFINSPTGVLLCVVIPSAIIIIAQAVSYATEASKKKKLMLAQAEERARAERVQLINDVVAAQNNASGAAVIRQPIIPSDIQFDDVEKQRVIEEYLLKQREEEAKKQAIIEEYLAKQKEAEEAAKEEAEAAKIKAIIAEFLAQQKAENTDNSAKD